MIDPRHLSIRRGIPSALIASFLVFHTCVTGFASALRETPMVRAVRLARPSVVNIHGKKTVPAYEDQLGSASSYKQVNGMGTGVVIDERGYAITNYHVIEGVRRIQVTLADKRTVTARLVAHDPATDLAIIKVKIDQPMPVIKIGTSSDLMPAEPVVAVGNAYGYRHTVTKGIISELQRTVQVSDEQTYTNLIQTDASINPGNSGGPLLNIDGEMIGINVAVRVGAQGIGFAIPVDQAMEVASRLLSIERSSSVPHGIIGKTVRADSSSHFIVNAIQKSSPADKAELKSGDVITAIGPQTIDRALDIERALLDSKSGEPVAVSVLRDGETISLNLEMTPAEPTRQTPTASRIWNLIGLRFVRVPNAEFERLGTEYRGGLKIVDIRESSAADEQGIKPGDILVGMHLWETVSSDNLVYILNRPDFTDFQPMKFYVIRGGDTLYGHMRVSRADSR